MIIRPYFEDNTTTLFKGDSLKLLKKIDENSVDLIFADPPYFLSNDGITCKNGKMVSVNKAEDKIDSLKEIETFNSVLAYGVSKNFETEWNNLGKWNTPQYFFSRQSNETP